jgi:hypothetical protein
MKYVASVALAVSLYASQALSQERPMQVLNRVDARLETIATQSWQPIKSRFEELKAVLAEKISRRNTIPNIYPSIIADPILELDGTGGDLHLVTYVDECMRLYHRDLEKVLENETVPNAEKFYEENHPRSAAVHLPDIGDFRNIRVTYAGDPVQILENERLTTVTAQDIYFDFTPHGENKPIHYRVTRPSTGAQREVDEVAFLLPTYNEYVLVIQATRDDNLGSARWQTIDNPVAKNIISFPKKKNMPGHNPDFAEHSGTGRMNP